MKLSLNIENVKYSQYCLMPKEARAGVVLCLMFKARGLYSEVKCIMGNGDMGAPVNRQTCLKTLPFRNIVGKQ